MGQTISDINESVTSTFEAQRQCLFDMPSFDGGLAACMNADYDTALEYFIRNYEENHHLNSALVAHWIMGESGLASPRTDEEKDEFTKSLLQTVKKEHEDGILIPNYENNGHFGLEDYQRWLALGLLALKQNEISDVLPKELNTPEELNAAHCFNRALESCYKILEMDSDPRTKTCFNIVGLIKAELGLLYEKGVKGVDQDSHKAFSLYTESCKTYGCIRARSFLSYCYKYGIGVDKNEEKSLNLLIKAAEWGYKPCLTTLGDYILSGNLESQNKEEGVKLLREAADKGVMVAQYYLGDMYARGTDPVTKDVEKAIHYWTLSAAQGHKAAANELVDLKASLPKTSHSFFSNFGWS